MSLGPKYRIQHSAKQTAAFWEKVQTSDDCWVWTAGRDGRNLYGRFKVHLTDGTRKIIGAHNFAYDLLIGQIPYGKYKVFGSR